MQKISAATGMVALVGYVAWAAYAPHIESARAELKRGELIIFAKERSVGTVSENKMTARAIAAVTYAGQPSSLPVTVEEKLVSESYGLTRNGYVEYRLKLSPTRDAFPGRRVTKIRFRDIRLEDRELGLSRPLRGEYETLLR